MLAFVYVGPCVCSSAPTCEVLPRLVGLAEVDGSLQNPEVRTRRVGELHQHVGHMEKLEKKKYNNLRIIM